MQRDLCFVEFELKALHQHTAVMIYLCSNVTGRTGHSTDGITLPAQQHLLKMRLKFINQMGWLTEWEREGAFNSASSSHPWEEVEGEELLICIFPWQQAKDQMTLERKRWDATDSEVGGWYDLETDLLPTGDDD